jgi:hypothetical protein
MKISRRDLLVASGWPLLAGTRVLGHGSVWYLLLRSLRIPSVRKRAFSKPSKETGFPLRLRLSDEFDEFRTGDQRPARGLRPVRCERVAARVLVRRQE